MDVNEIVCMRTRSRQLVGMPQQFSFTYSIEDLKATLQPS